MATTGKGFPYPISTDPVAQGAAAIQALAEFLDEKTGKNACGQVHVHLAGVVGDGVSVTFPAGRFVNPPRVVPTTDNAILSASIGTVNAGSFFLWIRHMNGAAGTDSTDAQWIANNAS